MMVGRGFVCGLGEEGNPDISQSLASLLFRDLYSPLGRLVGIRGTSEPSSLSLSSVSSSESLAKLPLLLRDC